MVPRETKGRSFKGSALYYLHDKRVGTERVRLTQERVAWTETLNLPTSDPEKGWKVMAWTASLQADLKRVAGIKSTGRKLDNPVYAYSLSWAPDEQPDRVAMMEAVRGSLKALEAALYFRAFLWSFRAFFGRGSTSNRALREAEKNAGGGGRLWG